MTSIRRARALALFCLCFPFGVSRAQPGFPPNDPQSWQLAGTAKILCSALFVSGRDEHEARAHLTSYFLGAAIDSITNVQIDWQRKLVRLTLADRITREAKLYGDQGCVIHQPGRDSVFFMPVRVSSTLPDAATMPWPMGDVLPNTPLPAEIDTVKLREAVDAAFANPQGLTAAFLVVYKGRIVAERYGNGANREMQLESWSAGKSIVGTLVGMLVHDGTLRPEDPAPVPEWHKVPNDPRAKIRVVDLMRMSSGLRFSRGSPEDIPGYADHDLGYTGAIDAYQFAVTRPLQFEPNTFGRYRNVDPLTLGLIVRDAVRKRGEEYLTWPQRALFDRIGIRRQVLETDPYGNFLLNGYDYGTARNWARIGLLYLNDGVWLGERMLPVGWTTFVSTPAPAWKDSTYGAMVWVNARGVWPLPRDAFAFRGAGLQDVYVIPSRDLVIVRMGHFMGSRAGSADLERAEVLLMQAIAQHRATPRYLTQGLFIASIEEGARIFTPARLLPFDHPEALGHEFPTVQQFHAGEDQILVTLGQAAGLRLAATLQRYPTQPDTLWPYAPFERPPVADIRAAPVITRRAAETPLPGLRAVAVVDRFPIAFIVDTRGLSLADRHMQQATTMGLDVSRAEFVAALTRVAEGAPATGVALIVYAR